MGVLSWSNESNVCGVLYTWIAIGHPKYLCVRTGGGENEEENSTWDSKEHLPISVEASMGNC